MDSFNIKLHATHSQVKMRLAEIRFDLRHTIRQVKVTYKISYNHRKSLKRSSAPMQTP